MRCGQRRGALVSTHSLGGRAEEPTRDCFKVERNTTLVVILLMEARRILGAKIPIMSLSHNRAPSTSAMRSSNTRSPYCSEGYSTNSSLIERREGKHA